MSLKSGIPSLCRLFNVTANVCIRGKYLHEIVERVQLLLVAITLQVIKHTNIESVKLMMVLIALQCFQTGCAQVHDIVRFQYMYMQLRPHIRQYCSSSLYSRHCLTCGL